jgi:hypothetical protein
MIACAWPAADFAIHTGADQSFGDARAHQQVVKPEAGIALPAVAQIVPECVDALIAVHFADRVGPSLLDY